jgi:hypothetical protein
MRWAPFNRLRAFASNCLDYNPKSIINNLEIVGKAKANKADDPAAIESQHLQLQRLQRTQGTKSIEHWEGINIGCKRDSGGNLSLFGCYSEETTFRRKTSPVMSRKP